MAEQHTGRHRRRETTAVISAQPHAIRFQRCKLVRLDGQTEEHELDPRETIVGSSPDCHVFVHHATVSRHHFAIVRDEQSYLIRDLGSTNGTLVDEVRVKEGFLRPGAVLTAGEVSFRFELAYQEAELPPSESESYAGLLGRSVRMREIFSAVDRIAPTEATVLIQGETGTGKGALARAIHAASKRSDGPFIVFDCGATVPSLVESELFGHERGAFTGAVKQNIGALEAARGGTLFIDELAELSLELQPKLLRALEERELTRVGSTKPVKLDCRIIAASQADLWSEVAAERFRRDLYFRLAVVTIPLPALRERQEDIALLINRFLREYGGRIVSFEQLSGDLQQQLLAYHWPGNIRELRNVVERICVMDSPSASGGLLRHESLGVPASAPIDLGSVSTAVGDDFHLAVDYALPFKDAKEVVVSAFEHEYLKRLLDRADNNIAQAAREAGINRTHLYTLLAKHGLTGRD